MAIPKAGLRSKERAEKIKWFRKFRNKVQSYSLVYRPQTIRTIWVREMVQKEET